MAELVLGGDINLDPGRRVSKFALTETAHAQEGGERLDVPERVNWLIDQTGFGIGPSFHRQEILAVNQNLGYDGDRERLDAVFGDAFSLDQGIPLRSLADTFLSKYLNEDTLRSSKYSISTLHDPERDNAQIGHEINIAVPDYTTGDTTQSDALIKMKLIDQPDGKVAQITYAFGRDSTSKQEYPYEEVDEMSVIYRFDSNGKVREENGVAVVIPGLANISEYVQSEYSLDILPVGEDYRYTGLRAAAKKLMDKFKCWGSFDGYTLPPGTGPYDDLIYIANESLIERTWDDRQIINSKLPIISGFAANPYRLIRYGYNQGTFVYPPELLDPYDIVQNQSVLNALQPIDRIRNKDLRTELNLYFES